MLLPNDINGDQVAHRGDTCRDSLNVARMVTSSPYRAKKRDEALTCSSGDDIVLFKFDRFETDKDFHFFSMSSADGSEIMSECLGTIVRF